MWRSSGRKVWLQIVAGGVVAAATMWSGGCKKAEEGVRTVTLVSPHPEGLKQEFERAFREWHRKKHGQVVQVVWKDLPGTGAIVKYVRNSFEQARRTKNIDAGIGVDLFFGGGVPAALQMKREGFLMVADVSEETLKGIPEELGGIRFCDQDRQWFGSALAAFGILYHVKFHRERGLAAPTTWNDLAKPEYFGWLALADPRSGSALVCYELVLQKNGWEKGWPMLVSIFANAKTITSTANVVPQEVMSGNALAGMCIDSYGWDTMARAGADVVRYFSPVNATAVTPDPIMLLRGAPDRELACRFIDFVLSEEGQSLLGLPVGHPKGPTKYPLYRLPIRPEIYEKYDKELMVKDRPYAGGITFRFDQGLEAQRNVILAAVIEAAVVEQKELAGRAWKAVIGAKGRADVLAIWNELPFAADQTAAVAGRFDRGNAEEKNEMRKGWRAFFKSKYEKILEMVGE